MLAIVVGAVLAIVSAWRGGVVDSAISSVLDILFAFPGILLAVLVAAVFGPSLTTAALALAVAYTPYIARVLRGAALRERSQPYIAALSRCRATRRWRICVRHLVPNVMPLIVAQAHDPVRLRDGRPRRDLVHRARRAAARQPTGALMVSGGQAGVLQGYVAEALAAGLCIVVVVVAVNLLGERLADRTPEQR